METRVLELHEALLIIQKTVSPILKEEIVGLDALLMRVLKVDVFSKVDMPPFDKSAMDGYAVVDGDVLNGLQVIGEASAGKGFEGSIQKGEAVRIMTGAPIPKGANKVVMKEIAFEENGVVSFFKSSQQSNICKKGEDIVKGDLLLKKGTRLYSRHIAVLAASGFNGALVYKKPQVAVFASGNELLEPGCELKKDSIYNSNGHQLIAECRLVGLEPQYGGILPDTFDEVSYAIAQAVKDNDLVIVSGGVSVGNYDFILPVLHELGFAIHFSELSMKPGKHTVFAVKDNKVVLGLPGNPVSTLTQFEYIGRAILRQFEGENAPPNKLFQLPFSGSYLRKSADRQEFLPATLNNKGEVVLLRYNGSAHIAALAEATVLVEVEKGVQSINHGELVHVRFI